MTELEALKLVKIVQSAYPRQEFPEDTVRVYVMSLVDLPTELATRAVMELIRTSKWVPTIAEIRQRATEIGCPMPAADEAWAEVQRAARMFSPGVVVDVQWSSDLVAEAVAMTGGLWGIAMTSRPEVLQRQFTDTYNALRQRRLDQLQVTPGLLAEVVEQANRRALPAHKGGGRTLRTGNKVLGGEKG